ncbi:Uncharacterized protein LW94_12048 [Fusarium fujikuroi]|nr:Uncharacterized protein LW94_12048 [Fusarium fujikuroi]
MGGGRDKSEVLSRVDPSGASKDDPNDRPMTDSVSQDTSEVLAVTELDDASSQSPRPDTGDAVGFESHENTKADHSDDNIAAATSKRQDSANALAIEVEVVEPDSQNALHDPENIVRQYEMRPITNDQHVAELYGTYAALVRVENKCIEVDHEQILWTGGPPNIPSYLLMLPGYILELLQKGNMKPAQTVCLWYVKDQQGATNGDKKPWTLKATKDLPMSEKAALPVGDPNDYLHGFQVALELRAKKLGWPEYEQIAAVNAAKMGEEARKKVIDDKHYLNIGDDLVEQLLRDFESAKSRAKEQTLGLLAIWRFIHTGYHRLWNIDRALPVFPYFPLCGLTKLGSKKTPIYVETRPLSDKRLYKKVGTQYWVLVSDRWVPSLGGEQYATLVALHRTDLHEHYNFLLSSQHPSASTTLRRLAEKYHMPARMWQHGIHPFLEVLSIRLPESKETMDQFIILAYNLISLMDETIPSFRLTWVECKGDLARYGMAVENSDIDARERWRNTAREEYTQVRNDDPTVGRLYHHLAMLVQPRSSSPDGSFDADVSRFLYYTKSLVVKTPFYAARKSVLTVIETIVGRNKEAAEKPASIPQTDQDHFLTAVAHLILASLEPETLKANGYEGSRNNHLQTVYTALEKIKVGGPAKISRVCPSAQLGLLLCLLLLGIPLSDDRWSPMMAKFAPDLVTAEDRADSDAMANASDIHDATIADQHHGPVSLGGRRYACLRGVEIHPEALTPYLNLILRQDEIQGAAILANASQSELITVFSPLNERTRLGKYASSTKDNIDTYLRDTEEQRKAERARSTATPGDGTVTTDEDSVIAVMATVNAEGSQTAAEESMATTEQITASDTTHKKGEDTKALGPEVRHANVLLEHFLVAGLLFAKEAEYGPCDKSLEKPAQDVEQTAEVEAVKQAQETTLTDFKTDSEARDGVLTDSASGGAAGEERSRGGTIGRHGDEGERKQKCATARQRHTDEGGRY